MSKNQGHSKSHDQDVWGKIKQVGRKEGFRTFLRLTNGVERLLLGPLTPNVRTPSHIPFMWEKVNLVRYMRRKKPRYSTPILFIPPLMVTPDIFDLRAGHTFVGHLLHEGLDVYLLDLGVPTGEDTSIRIEDYVLDFIPQAIKKIREISGQEKVSLLGWSMGGIFIVLYLSLYAKQSHVRNAVILGSPVDYSKMFPFNVLARLTHLPLMKATDIMGNIPPILSSNGFKLLSPIGLVLRYKDLIINYWDREWIAGFETVNSWVDGFIPYPGSAFKQFVSEFIENDRLKKKKLSIGGKLVDPARITNSVLVVAGTTDIIAPADSVSPLLQMISSKDKQVLEVPLGHIGMVAGGQSPDLVWKPVTEWLINRSSS